MIQAKEIEQAVLGLAIQHEDALVSLLSEVTAEDFTGDQQKLFIEIAGLFRNDDPVNAATLKDRGLNGEVENAIGAASGVKKDGVITACKYLKKYTTRRKLIDLCGQYREKAQSHSEDTEQLLAAAGTDFFSLLSDNDSGRIHHSSQSIMMGLEEIQQPIDTSDRIYTGLDVDNIIKGFRPGQLVIVGGKTSHGKSVFVQNLMLKAALDGQHTGLITMEMTSQEITERIFSMASKVKLDHITERNLSDSHISVIKAEAQRIKQSAGYTIVDESMTIDRLYATARRLCVKEDMKMLIVDYLQQVSADAPSREQEIETVVRTLKDIATDMNIPVIALSQFNRAVDGRPQLDKFRGSGAIEQWANTAILLWNPSVDGLEKFPDTTAEGKWAGESTANVIELHVAKNRGGKTGPVKVHFDGSIQKFSNLTYQPSSAMDYL